MITLSRADCGLIADALEAHLRSVPLKEWLRRGVDIGAAEWLAQKIRRGGLIVPGGDPA